MFDPEKPSKKPLIYYCIISVVAILLFNALVFPAILKSSIKQIAYSDFLAMVDEGKVKEVSLSEDGGEIALLAVDDEGNDVVKNVAAGIIEKIRDITIFLNPTEGSYARLGNNTAPDRVNWSSRGESELMYIETCRGQTRAELRSPDAGSNPYLVYALLINAGLYGIEKKLSLPEEMNDHGVSLPGSKKEAAKLARMSEFVRNYVPEGILREYV